MHILYDQGFVLTSDHQGRVLQAQRAEEVIAPADSQTRAAATDIENSRRIGRQSGSEAYGPRQPCKKPRFYLDR